MAKAWLELDDGGGRRRFALGREDVIVGRAHTCTLAVLDETLSRRHFRIREEAGDYRIRDMGSRNGSFVDGVRVEETVKLEHGMRIVAGSAEFVFLQDASVEADSFLANMEAGWQGTDSIIEQRLPADGAAVTDAEHAAERLTLLYESARMFVGFADVDALLRSVGERLYRHTGADTIAVLLADDPGGKTRCVGQWAGGVLSAEAAPVVSRNVVREAIATRAGILSAAAQADDRFAHAESIHGRGITSVVCAPMVFEDRAWGVIYMDTRRRETPLGPEELELVTCLASLAAVFLEGLRRRDEAAETTRKRALLERYFSQGLTEKLLSGDSDLGAIGDSVEGTVLCADIRSFTKIAEEHDAKTVVALLNDFYAAATAAIFENEGVVDKYAGDAVLAVFGSPIPDAQHATHSVRCAEALLEKLRRINPDRTGNGLPPIEAGIGIATGPFIHGNVGDARKLEYTVIGHTVNVAFRLADIAEAGQIVLSDAARQAAREHAAIPIGSTLLKGRSDKTEIFRLPIDALPCGEDG